MQDVEAALARANLPMARHRVCLDADLVGRWHAAQAAADAAGQGRLSGPPADAVAEADRLRAEVDAASVEFVLRALPFAAYNRLVLSHPPRKGNVADQAWGFNTFDFTPALVRACLVEPVVSDAQWERLLNALTDRQWDDISSAVLRINRAVAGAVPPSSTASDTTGD